MSRPQGWSRLRNSRLLHVGVGRHQAENAPFPPLAEMPTDQPCDGVAEKVSLVPFACSVLEGAGQSRHTLHANGTSPGNGEERECQPLMTVGHCEWKDRGVIVKLSLFLEGLGHGQPHLQELRPQRRRRRLLQFVRRGNHGHCPQPPLPRPMEETTSRATDTSAATRAHGRQHIRSTAPVPVDPALALQAATIMRKIAACWTCGRTF